MEVAGGPCGPASGASAASASVGAASGGGKSAPAEAQETHLGLTLSELTQEQLKELDVDGGVLITSAGRLPACSCPAWGSKSSHTTCPASGT